MLYQPLEIAGRQQTVKDLPDSSEAAHSNMLGNKNCPTYIFQKYQLSVQKWSVSVQIQNNFVFLWLIF